MRWAVIFLSFAPLSALAHNANDQLCQVSGGSAGCIDFGRRDGYRPAPSRPTIDPQESSESRERRRRELQESLEEMEHPKPERPLSADIPAVLREDVIKEDKVVHVQSSALLLAMGATYVIQAIEVGVLVEIFIAAAPTIIVTGLVLEAARSQGWIFAKTRKPPADAWDPNGAKAPGRPGPAEEFDDSKNGPTWGQAPNGRWGWVDNKGDIWVPTGHSRGAHGGPQWDIQHKQGGYTNKWPGGRTR